MLLAEIEWGKLGELVWAAPIAGLVVSVAYAVVILGAARAEEARRSNASGAAAVYGLLMIVGLAAFLGAMAFGIYVITDK